MKMGSLLKKSLIALLPISLGLGVLLGVAKKPVQEVSGYSASSLPTTIDLNDTSAANIRSYYSTLNSLSTSERQGTNLLKNLKTILKNGQKYYSYESGENVWKMYEITDRDWDKSPASSISGYNSSTKKITGYSYNTTDPYIHALYVNRDVNNQTTAWSDHQQTQWGINREHVWPKAEGFDSSGAGGARGDPRHLMAGNGYANNIHSNYYYGYVKSSGATDCGSKYSNLSGNLKGTSKTLNSGTVFEPQDSDKGDIARSIFYMVARYNYLSGSDSDGIDANNPNLALTQDISDWSSSGYTSSTSRQGKLGVLTDLLAWHHADPVDEYEIHRNNLLYTNFTNNRNPFIDFPEWVDYIWGTATYNGTTYSSYSSTPTGYATPSTDTINGYNNDSGDTVGVTGVSLNKSETSIEVGSSEALTASISPANATDQTVTWNSSDTTVATVSSSGRVNALADGTATITVTTNDGNFTDTCSVTVYSSSGGGGETITTWNKVSDNSNLSVGDKIIITNAASNYALSTNQASNNRTATPVTDTDGELSWASNLTYNPQELTLTDATSLQTNAFGLSTGSGFLYASAANSNNLRTQDTLNVDGAFVINIDGDATIQATGSGNRNLMRFNPNNGSPIFSCYSSTSTTGSLLAVYKQTTTVVPLERELKSISLDLDDVQTTFYKWEEFNYEGLGVIANYSDLTDDIVTPTSVSSPDFSTTGTKTVIVSYTEDGTTKTATYEITVINPTLSSLSISDEITDFYIGEDFVKPTVTAHFTDSSSYEVTDSAVCSGYDLSVSGNQTVTVSYTNQGTTVTTTYSISVSEVLLESISISGYETSFSIGDNFSFGGTVVAHYNSGATSDVTNSSTFDGYNMSQAGNQTVTVHYSTATATYNILVDAPSDTETYTATIVPSTFSTKSYADNNGSHSITATNVSDDSDTLSISFTSYQVMQQSSLVQFQRDYGFIYNTESFGVITNIEIVSTAGSFYVGYGDDVLDSHIDSNSGSAPAEFFNISVGGATGKITSIVITFEVETPVTYSKVTNINDLGTGDEIVFIATNNSNNYSPGAWQPLNSYFGATSVSLSGSTFTYVDSVTTFTVIKNEDKYSFLTSTSKYIGSTTSSKMIQSDEITSNCEFDLSIANDGKITMIVNSLKFRYNSSRFSCYSYNTGSAAVIYKKTSQVEADTWSSDFLSGTKNCVVTGWSTYSTSYSELSNGAKREILVCESNSSIDYCKRSQAMARYEYILGNPKYNVGLSNFISGRNVSLAKPVSLPIFLGKNTNTVAVIVIVSIISVSSIGGYFFMKSKRKEEF